MRQTHTFVLKILLDRDAAPLLRGQISEPSKVTMPGPRVVRWNSCGTRIRVMRRFGTRSACLTRVFSAMPLLQVSSAQFGAKRRRASQETDSSRPDAQLSYAAGCLDALQLSYGIPVQWMGYHTAMPLITVVCPICA